MSENVGGSGGSSGGSFIRGPREFYGGVALIVVAGFAYWASLDLPGMRGFSFGPGTAPRGFAMVLGALGLAVAMTGLFTKGPGIDRGVYFIVCSIILFGLLTGPIGLVPATFVSVLVSAGLLWLVWYRIRGPIFNIRGPLFVTLSVAVFALSVRSLGLAFASFISICAAAGATPEARPLETIVWGVVLTAFCCFLFPVALNLPMQLWPISSDPMVLLKGLSFSVTHG